MRKDFAIGCGTVRQRRLAIEEHACQILLLLENELNKTDCIKRHYAQDNERKKHSCLCYVNVFSHFSTELALTFADGGICAGLFFTERFSKTEYPFLKLYLKIFQYGFIMVLCR